jgi:glycosyltransferase involved in cell wall biosynthesis
VSRKRTIAMVAACPFPYPRGTPIRIYHMADALSRRGHQVHVVTYHLGEDASGAPFPIHRTRRVERYSKTSPGPSYRKIVVVDPLLAMKLREVQREHPIDVIHAHHYEGLLVALASGRGSTPVVFDVHTLLESELPYYGLGLASWTKRWIGRTLDRRLPGRADHVIAVTDDIRSRLIESRAASSKHVSVIPNGVDCQPFNSVTQPAPSPAGPRMLIFTGNLAAYQGIDLLLDAFKDLRDRREDVRLMFVTEDSFEPYEQRAADLGVRPFIDVQPSGFDEVPALLSIAEVALNPRVDCDGLPQKLLNYMAAGKPVVSFAGSAKHLVTEEHGLVVADGDTAAFGHAIERLLDDATLANRLGRNGRELVRSTLSWDAAARKVESVYEKVL